MFGVFRRAALRKAERSIELNAFSKSKVTSTFDVSAWLRWSHCRATCTVASQPPRVPTPTCTGSRCSLTASETEAAKHFPTSLRQVSPTAIGRRSPAGFGSATNDAPQSHARTSAIASPRARMFANSARCRMTSSRRPGASASFRCCGRKPLGPAAAPRAKPDNALRMDSASTSHLITCCPHAPPDERACRKRSAILGHGWDRCQGNLAPDSSTCQRRTSPMHSAVSCERDV